MYLDHNATSPMPDSVRAAVSDAMASAWANPSSPHGLGQASAATVQRCRQNIAERLSRRPKNVFFTSGATEANAWVLSQSNAPVVTCATEHPSVLEWSDETIGVNEHGVIDLGSLEQRLKRGPALVSVMAANNETGVLQPVEHVLELCRRHGAPFHCDATQIFGRTGVKVEADFLTVSAHKFGGPRGVGALITAEPPTGILRGGKQERGHRAGTLNVPGIVGFSAALDTGRTWGSEERDKLEIFCREQGGRIVGDGGCHFMVVDVAVLPEHQGRGLGKRIMAALTAHMEAHVPASASVCLIADGEAHHLYAKYGFRLTTPESVGMLRKF